MQVGIGFSAESDHIKAAKEAVDNAMPGINKGKVDLAFLFSTIKFNHPLVLKTIAESLKNIPLLGLNTPAVMFNLGIYSNGLLVVLFSLPEGIYFNTACVKEVSTKTALASGEKLGEELLYGCQGVRRNLSIIFSDGCIADKQNIIFGLQEKIGRSFPMVGASTCGLNARTEKACLYFGSLALNDAVCGILFGDKLNFGLGIKHGWQPLGKPRKITRSSGNTINEIDDKAGVDLYQEYLAKNVSGLKKNLGRISTFYPLGIDITRKKEYLLRSLSSIEDDGSLVFNGDTPQGSTVRLMISSKESCLESTRQAAKLAKKSLGNQKPKLLLVFNSLARAILLGRQENMEIEIIKDVFGKDTPIAGVYTLTEQAPLSSAIYLGKSYFHNNSIAILAIAG
ncbi:MAG: hypothetical protein COT38_05745 [Candidatus Omnitrophica bacterium CG08_land_8_20_14_0_20_41_16]|uniref:FIST domain-containing protein n=1 Tax=Candidatus Sherwoodlollariibacterium unditelluris TaxID=1974757 RepID=A0A2G9YJN6_9BACT|nr:MAG: hypothetical protein COX41_02755 [Candidatus Omnitrophica bacterium CG23_combo_of_CG06-09_8_20_14_all_41_10]PIS33356.1 MAG: hypothetical protein COT38_05745 [Candidatus Omnitrophica bacterium CG08_land_8_20_14_0_20_41_16]